MHGLRRLDLGLGLSRLDFRRIRHMPLRDGVKV